MPLIKRLIKKKLFSVLMWALAVGLIAGFLPGMCITAYADDPASEPEIWNSDIVTKVDRTYEQGVKVTSDITLTIEDYKTVTVYGGIDAEGHTLTVDGTGTLIVTGYDGSEGVFVGTEAGRGGLGGDGILGNLVIINEATVRATGGIGGQGSLNAYFGGPGGNGGNGGDGVHGNVTINGDGTAIVTGGKGGIGGTSEADDDGECGSGGPGGNGGYGISGSLTVQGNGAVIASGGNGGAGGTAEKGPDGEYGSHASAIDRDITVDSGLRVLESENNRSWSFLSGDRSLLQYVKVNPSFNVESVISNPTYVDLLLGGTQQMEADITPDYAADQTVLWSSSDPNVATVDESGMVTAVGAGTAIITATATNGTEDTSDDKTATSTIHVVPDATVLIDVGENHAGLFTDELVNTIFSEIANSEASIEGNTITLTCKNTYLNEATLREKIDNAVWKYVKMDNSEKYWSVGYKPLDKYTTYQDYSSDVDSQEHKNSISNNLKYYLLWKKPYEKLEMDNGDPVCGMISWKAEPKTPEGMSIHPGHSCWKDAGGNEVETLEGGKEYTYRANILLDQQGTLWKHYFNKDVLTVNVKDGEVVKIENGDDSLEEAIYVTYKTTVEHVWDSGKITTEASAIAEGIKTYTCTVCGEEKTESIPALGKQANPLTIKAKTATVKYKKLKKKAQTLAVTRVITFTKMINDKKTYTLSSAKKGKKSYKKYFKINQTTGKVTIKKGLKKGTYKVQVKVKAAGNANYNASDVNTVTFKIKVK